MEGCDVFVIGGGGTGSEVAFSLSRRGLRVGVAERDRALREVLAPLLGRRPDQLGAQVCVGSADHCAELLSRYSEAGCQRVFLWPLGDEPQQIELAAEIAPHIRR